MKTRANRRKTLYVGASKDIPRRKDTDKHLTCFMPIPASSRRCGDIQEEELEVTETEKMMMEKRARFKNWLETTGKSRFRLVYIFLYHRHQHRHHRLQDCSRHLFSGGDSMNINTCINLVEYAYNAGMLLQYFRQCSQ